ncbi:MAG: Na+/H+ antiporter subunit E [Roseateles sp.]|uniref:Na+/H+ antiporter subunit E n=1 Tax=Roseateles sp. TaxID=1971397 RepID=UPI004036F974
MTPRWLAHPALSALLAAAWLLLQQSLDLPQLITAAALGIGLPWLLRGFLPAGGRLRHAGMAVRLLGVVLSDIVTSNLTVARIVLTPGSNPRPAWVLLPLDLTHPAAIALLATIITTTPGTVSCIVDETGRRIIVHALDCADPAAMAAQIKQRYERPLKEIFE